VMPIRKSQRALYPRDWPAISLRIRERARQRCEACAAPNGKLIIRDRENPALYVVHDPCGGCVGGDPECVRAIRVALTVAHLDHNPANCDDDNLLALCQRCHLMYGAGEHARNARETRRSRKAIGDLF
jgi:hypothetical protein